MATLVSVSQQPWIDPQTRDTLPRDPTSFPTADEFYIQSNLDMFFVSASPATKTAETNMVYCVRFLCSFCWGHQQDQAKAHQKKSNIRSAKSSATGQSALCTVPQLLSSASMFLRPCHELVTSWSFAGITSSQQGNNSLLDGFGSVGRAGFPVTEGLAIRMLAALVHFCCWSC